MPVVKAADVVDKNSYILINFSVTMKHIFFIYIFFVIFHVNEIFVSPKNIPLKAMFLNKYIFWIQYLKLKKDIHKTF